MNPGDATLLRGWCASQQKVLEWTVGDRTFQVSGIKGAEGCYERFFDPRHTSRREIPEAEMVEALQSATSPLELYSGEKGSGIFYASAEAALASAQAFFAPV